MLFCCAHHFCLHWIAILIVMKTRVIPGYIGLTVIAFLVLIDIYLVVLAVGANSQNLTVTFLDVGQGDATLIETPSGTQVLIDGGQARSVNRPLSGQLPFYDRSLDMVVATHADADHIGGLVDVLGDYEVGRVAVPAHPAETPVYAAFRSAVEEEAAESALVDELTRGSVVHLGDGAYLLTLFPLAEHRPTGSNDSSLMLKLIYGDTSWVFTGDSPQAIEEYLAGLDGQLLDADVLKVGHHGSDTSSSEVFLSAASPQTSVISAGADNSYGHPEASVLKRLQAQEIETVCTCEEGTIQFKSNGKEVTRTQ